MLVFGLWFSGVFANTIHFAQILCIPLETSDYGGRFYVPLSQRVPHTFQGNLSEACRLLVNGISIGPLSIV